MTQLPLTIAQSSAAQLTADGDKSDAQIAEAVGVSRATIARWKKQPAFIDRVAAIVAATAAALESEGIRMREQRLLAAESDFRRMQQIIDERAGDAEFASVPGWKSGLLVHDVKSIGGGEYATRVDLYKFDAALVKERRELLQHVAIEMGQWTEKRELDHKGEPYLEMQARILQALSEVNGDSDAAAD
jgi:hypothetical protein